MRTSSWAVDGGARLLLEGQSTEVGVKVKRREHDGTVTCDERSRWQRQAGWRQGPAASWEKKKGALGLINSV